MKAVLYSANCSLVLIELEELLVVGLNPVSNSEVFYCVYSSGGARGSDSRRNGVRPPPERRMENGVSP